MKKKTYVKPLLTSEEFVPQEYVAACWSIWCNVPNGIGFYDSNGNQKWDRIADERIAEGTGCNVEHTASGIDASGPVANAWWQPGDRDILGIFQPSGKAYEVFYWKDDYKSGHHFSKVSDAQWKENPNAS